MCYSMHNILTINDLHYFVVNSYIITFIFITNIDWHTTNMKNVHKNSNPPEKLCNITIFSGEEGSRRTKLQGKI